MASAALTTKGQITIPVAVRPDLHRSEALTNPSLRRYARAKVDFADCLIERSGHSAGCRETVTFDAGAAQ
jgi:hypothetical protein